MPKKSRECCYCLRMTAAFYYVRHNLESFKYPCLKMFQPKTHNKQTPSQIKKTAGQYLCVSKACDADQQAFTMSLYSITLFTQIYQFCDNQRENSPQNI